jgi:hypothetical protein
MAAPMPHSQLQRNGIPGNHHPSMAPTPGPGGPTDPNEPGAPSPAHQEFPSDDARLLQEANPAVEGNPDLLAVLGSEEGAGVPPDGGTSLEQLIVENAELRIRVADLQQLAGSAANPTDQGWAEREKEYESLLEEKSEIIRSLHLKIQELQEQGSREEPPAEPRPPLPANEAELQAVFDELERERAQLDLERRQLEEDRAQLQQDEETLMKQMREMEMAMSRERADLARQRNELQRLHNDLRHELELAARDASLRDRLIPLQRRHQEFTNRKGGAAPAGARPGPAAGPASAPPGLPSAKKEGSLLRRLFGSGE